jgi:hypothetical protein
LKVTIDSNPYIPSDPIVDDTSWQILIDFFTQSCMLLSKQSHRTFNP